MKTAGCCFIRGANLPLLLLQTGPIKSMTALTPASAGIAYRSVCRLIVIFGLLLAGAGASPTAAQECCPAWEVFGGYSYFSSSASGDNIDSPQFGSRYGQAGPFGAIFVRNINHKLGVVADFSFNRRSSTIGAFTIGGMTVDASVKQKTYSFLFGPRVSARSDGISYFGEALIGWVRRDVRATATAGADGIGTTTSFDLTSNNLALGIGGGVDIEVSKHLCIRFPQFDYIPVRVQMDSSTGGAWSHNYRLQAGVVFRWGLVK